MNRQQALALLELVADCYLIANQPDPPAEPSGNGAAAQPKAEKPVEQRT